MAHPGVVGVGVGVNAEGEPVVRILLERGGITGLPDVVDSVPVETVVSGLIQARCDTTTHDCHPAPLGVSIGHPDVTAGTLGALVTDGTNVFVLSNNHVLANVNRASLGDGVLQPGTFDGGTDPADRIGTLAAFVPLTFGGGSNSVDAAIALTSADLVSNATLSSLADDYGTPTSTLLPATVGMPVQKCGRTTGCTQGVITEVMLDVSVCYETAGPFRCKTSALFTDQIGIGGGSFSAGGDSGSLIVDTDGDPDPVGLLFAGSSTRTIANHMSDVLSSLGVSMYQGTVAPNTAPEITSTPPLGSVAEGVAYSYDVVATDADATDTITYQLPVAPPGMTIDSSGLISWAPGDTDAGQSSDPNAGQHPVTVRATDNLGAFDEQSYTINVEEALNAAPAVVITAPLIGFTIAPGEGITFTGTATDSEDGALTPSLTWASDLDGPLGTGGSLLTMELTSPGTHIVTASVADGETAVGSDSITVNVVAPGDTTVTLTDLGSVNQGRNWVGRVKIGFSGADEVTWSWSTGVGGICRSTSQPCVAETGDLRKNISSATLTILDPTNFVGPSEITVTKP